MVLRTTTPAALALLALAASCSAPSSRGGESPVPGPEAGAKGDESGPVAAHLVADVSRVGPGQEFTLGVKLDVDEGWYIHWLHPGDGGEPTRVSLDAPPEVHYRDPRFPGPSRFDTPGGEVRYGYSGPVLVSIPAVAGDELAGADVELAAQVEWVACRDDDCEPGRATPRLSLPVATPEAPSQPANADAFDAHRQSLPSDLEGIDGVTTAWQKAGEGRAELAIEVSDASELAFFPHGDVGLVGQAVTPAEGGLALRLWLEARGGSQVEGVIRIRREDETRFARMSLEIPDSR